MERGKSFGWGVASVTIIILLGLAFRIDSFPSADRMIFWIALLLIVGLLPVSLGFETQVTMAFPILLAIAILFEPPIAMGMAALGEFDMREFRKEIPLWRALFNRAQLMLAVGAASGLMVLVDDPFGFPRGASAIGIAAIVFLIVNLSLVAAMVVVDRRVPVGEALRSLLPNPIGGFLLVQAVLAALGAATAAAYEQIGAYVAFFLIPLLFARLSILGARAQQELSERVRKQQQQLLEATEQVFQERESERNRIAEEIHDGSLQMLAAASYGCGNAAQFISAGHPDRATSAVETARVAINDAMTALRESLVDLRRSSVEAGGLMTTIRKFADQVTTLWGTEVRIEGEIEIEPPAPVAIAAFQILQEGLTNALKHAQTSTVTIKINDDDGMVHIVVEDDGAGFDIQSEVGAEHVGMRLMKERAAKVGGHLQLDSEPGRGTRLEAILPGGVAR